MRVLVTGGAGYVGSHVVLALLAADHEVHVVDDFTHGTPAAIGRAETLTGRRVTIHAADVSDIDATERVFATAEIDAVVHLAGIRRSSATPDRVLDVYETNLATTFTLLRCMAWYGVTRFVLSSAADVYGSSAGGSRLAVGATTAPDTPLGRSLLGSEHLLADLAANGSAIRAAVLRRFTTGGAHPSGRMGQHSGRSASALLARLSQVAAGQRTHLEIPGGDLPTPDGTPVRDVVHVADVADAHVAALAAVTAAPAGVRTWNVGTGRATSVLDVLHTFETVSGRPIAYEVVPATSRVPAQVVADITATVPELGWSPQHDLETICRDHWRWASGNPKGYPPTVVPETPWRGGVGHRLRLLSPLAR